MNGKNVPSCVVNFNLLKLFNVKYINYFSVECQKGLIWIVSVVEQRLVCRDVARISASTVFAVFREQYANCLKVLHFLFSSPCHIPTFLYSETNVGCILLVSVQELNFYPTQTIHGVAVKFPKLF
jgi:hypothetical protein